VKRKYYVALLIICVLVSLVLAEGSWHLISDIFRGQIEVAKAQALTIYPDNSTSFPDVTITGQPFNISIDVENPNPVTINGKIMVNFTKPDISRDDVVVTSADKFEGHPLYVWKYGPYEDTLVFIIEVNGGDRYFHFSTGLNANITYFTVQYNAEGTYDWALAVIQ